MTWPFCPQCGTIMDPPSSQQTVHCIMCNFSCHFEDLNTGEVVTRSAPTAKPAWITEEKDDEALEKHATIEEPCPKCGNPEMYFYTMQLRSVDEGSTVFYECGKCSHKYSINN